MALQARATTSIRKRRSAGGVLVRGRLVRKGARGTRDMDGSGKERNRAQFNPLQVAAPPPRDGWSAQAGIRGAQQLRLQPTPVQQRPSRPPLQQPNRTGHPQGKPTSRQMLIHKSAKAAIRSEE